MASRKSISKSLVQQRDFNPVEASAFVRQKAKRSEQPAQRPLSPGVPIHESTNQVTSSQQSGQLIRVTVRLDASLASALKRASLERELRGMMPHSQQDIVRTVLEPWLREEGFLTESPAVGD